MNFLDPVGYDKDGPYFDSRKVSMFAANDIVRRVARGDRKMAASIEEAKNMTDDAIAHFEKSLDKMIQVEKRLVDSVKKSGGNIRQSMNELGGTVTRLLRDADLDKLEKYTSLLERTATAMTTLANMQDSGKLEKIMQAIK